MLSSWMIGVLAVVVMLACAPTTHATILPCGFTDGSGSHYNLSELLGFEFSASDAKWNYHMAMCSADASNEACVERGGSICVFDVAKNTQGKFVGTMGAFNNAPLPTWMSFSDEDPNAPTDGVLLIYKNGLLTNAENNNTEEIPTVTVRIPCDPKRKLPDPEFQVDWTMGFAATVQLTPNKIGCAGSHPTPLVLDTGMSTGWILILVFTVGMTFYCCVGTIYNMSQFGTSGLDSMPHSEFWRNLPSLVVEGWRFTLSKCKRGGLSRHNDGLYSDL